MSVSEDDLVRRINETRAALGLPRWLLSSEQVTRDEVAAMVRDECSKVQVEHAKSMETVKLKLRNLEQTVWPDESKPSLSERFDRVLTDPFGGPAAGIGLTVSIGLFVAWVVQIVVYLVMHLRWVN